MITLETPPLTLSKKLVAVINEKLDIGVALNALAHMSLGLGTILGPDEALMCDYQDADSISHSSISAYPFIVLKGRPSKIREALAAAKTKGIITVDFTNTMTIGSYHDQMVRTKATLHSDLEIYGAVFYGEVSEVSELTRKFSLFK